MVGFLHLLLLALVTWSQLEQAQFKIDNADSCTRGKARIHSVEVDEIPSLQKIVVGTTMEDKEQCIITYCSYNSTYPLLLQQLLEKLPLFFKGHILYRVGGWPGMENGCLEHCHVPYAFKVCAFKEAQALGYKKVLWLDALIEPLKNLQPLFDHLDKYPCIYRYSLYPFQSIVTEEIIEDFQLSNKEINACYHIASGILGFNFSSKAARQSLADWHEAVLRGKSFYTHFPEQIPLSIIFYRNQLARCAFKRKLLHINIDYREDYFFRINYAKKQ